jgi:glucosamine--fructose-6-phosphate aminotransferase (isomerizing)
MSEKRGTYTLQEILDQPNAWQNVLNICHEKSDVFKRLVKGIDEVVFTGCGSGYNISMTAASAFQQLTGKRARAVPAAEVFLFPETVFIRSARYAVVLISRSGDTTETVKAMEFCRKSGYRTLAITCYADSKLAKKSDEAIVLDGSIEKSVTTTKSYTAMVLSAQLIPAMISNNRRLLQKYSKLPRLCAAVLKEAQPLGKQIGNDSRIRKFAFVGSGPYIGIAREGQLKIKEMTLLPSDSYPLLDYRHGPKSNVDSSMLVTILGSDSDVPMRLELAKELKGLGGRILNVADRREPRLGKKAVDFQFITKSDLPDFVRDVLYVPLIHFISYYKSMHLGQNPDAPRHLTHWVSTKSLV